MSDDKVIEQHSFMEKGKRMSDDKVIEQDSFMEKRKRMSDDKVFEKHSFVEKRRMRMKDLPSDLWLSIFLRLSVADLLSLKAVCKTFHQLISSDLFVGMHLKDFTKYQKATTAFFITTDPTASNLKYDPEKRTISVWHDESRFDYWCTRHAIDIRCHHRHRVIDSYLGYLLVQICDRLWLCNPITGSYHFLPSIDGFSLDFGCWKIAYDDVSEQYKVFGLRIWKNKVCLYVFDAHRDGKFSLPRKTTTTMEVGSDQMDSLIKGSVLVNGNLYWLIISTRSCGSIVSANVTTEEVKTRSCHHTRYITWSSNYDNISAANGKFYLSQCFHPTTYLELWVLEGVEGENANPRWTMKHTTSLFSILPSPLFSEAYALGVFRDKLLLIIKSSQQYYQYDLSRREFEKVMLARGTKCERSMRPIKTATGFIPSTIL